LKIELKNAASHLAGVQRPERAPGTLAPVVRNGATRGTMVALPGEYFQNAL
jgi:hypothetical protein